MDSHKYCSFLKERVEEGVPVDIIAAEIKQQFFTDAKLELDIFNHPKADKLMNTAWNTICSGDIQNVPMPIILAMVMKTAKTLVPLIDEDVI